MSRRGASLPAPRFEFREVSALGRPVVALVRQLRREGLSSAEVCSLLAQAAAVLAQQEDGLTDRGEWLSLAGELFDTTAEPKLILTSPGGAS